MVYVAPAARRMGCSGPIAGGGGAAASRSQINAVWERGRHLREDEGCCSIPDVENREVFPIYLLSVATNNENSMGSFPSFRYK